MRQDLLSAFAFSNHAKHKRFKDGCTIMPISVTNKENLAILGDKMGVSRAIAYMIEIGLISVESDKYQFGAYYEKDNKSKSYYYYKENEDKVKAYCEARGIIMYVVQNKVYDISEIKNIHKSIDKSKVRFASRLKLIRPEGLSKADFEKQLTLCLYENYPGLQFHMEADIFLGCWPYLDEIHCEANKKPENWDPDWNRKREYGSCHKVIWGSQQK